MIGRLRGGPGPVALRPSQSGSLHAEIVNRVREMIL